MPAASAHPHRYEVRYDAHSSPSAKPVAAAPTTRTGGPGSAAFSAAAPAAAVVLAAPAVPVRQVAVALVPGLPPRLEIPGHQTPHPVASEGSAFRFGRQSAAYRRASGN
ncbi:hypothetical protein H181DRAFT_03370 [Streptomyces sp. WMMB 714]|nr:hypothetical protein H181DRAFT_03370 [Streptomyces sp. WMMB 714]